MGSLFLFLGYMGVPVAFSLIAAVLVVTAFTPVSYASMMAQLFNGMDVEALVAIPFFLLVGDLMTSANVTVRMIRLAQSMVGHLRGGLAQVVTLFSMFFAGISGSSAADVAVLTRTVGPEMNREGYDRAFTAALIAAASTMANLIPPSIMAVVYGATGNVSIGGLFLGGVVPGLLVGIGLMIYSHFFGPVGTKRQRASFGGLLAGDERGRHPAGHSDHHHGRHSDRPVHAHRSRRYRSRLHRLLRDSGAQFPAPAQPSARFCDDRTALFDTTHHDRRGISFRLDARLPAWAGSRFRLDRDIVRQRSVPDHAATGRALRRGRRFHRCHPRHHYFHADYYRPHPKRGHQSGSHGGGHHRDAGIRPDHAALRALPADGGKIRRHRLWQSDAGIVAALHRVLRRHRLLYLFPG